VPVRIPEKNQAAAGNAVHHGTFRLLPDEFHGFFMAPAGEGGTHQAAVAYQRGTEQVRKEDGKTPGQGRGYHGKPFCPGYHGVNKDTYQYGHYREKKDQASLQLAVDLKKGLIGIEILHDTGSFEKTPSCAREGVLIA
jgi:hypothetical protein